MYALPAGTTCCAVCRQTRCLTARPEVSCLSGTGCGRGITLLPALTYGPSLTLQLQRDQSNAAVAMMRDIARGKRPLDDSVDDGAADDVPPAPKRRNVTHAVLAERYHTGGAVAGDSAAIATARQELARIQRDHRLRRRDDEEPSQTPDLDALVRRQAEDRDVDGDDADDGDEADDDDEIQSTHADPPTIQPKKRGRPRKQPLPDADGPPRPGDGPRQEPNAPPDARPPRPRGRPRKEPQILPDAPPPRPRGRPRVRPLPDPDAPRRPPGRPRKEPPAAPAKPARRGRPPKARRPVGRPRKDRVNDPPPRL